MPPTRVILMSCGSYNPPTNMHLRMFEIARDHLHRMGTHIVVGGVISPVHDAYAKKELASSSHRCAMLKLALQKNDWIRLSTWEARQNGWTKTRISLQHHQNLLNSILSDPNNMKHYTPTEDVEWIPENIKNSPDNTPIQIKLLCGADLLESFGTCDLWAEEDIDAIVGEHGLVVITREGSNPNKFIYDSDILSKYMHNIYIVTEWIPNEVSSTRIRRALKRGESVRYLIQDAVIDYIYQHGIYDAKPTTSAIKLELTSPNANNYLTTDPKYQNTILTPSPSDVTMESPSPIEIISIDVPDTVLRKNVQNATSVACIAAARGHSDFEEAREKFINALVAENGNAKHLAAPKAAYPGLAKQIIATETGESQLLEEVGSAEDEKKLGKVVEVESRLSQVEQAPLVSDVPVTSSNLEDDAKDSDKDDTIKDAATAASKLDENRVETLLKEEASSARFANSSRDIENKSPVSSSSLSTTSAIDNSGRHECALSDFSVDKEDYRLTRYGQDADVQEEDIPCSTNDSDTKDLPSYSEEFSREQRSFYVPKEDDVTGDQKVPDNVIIDQENSDDSIRCSSAQVVVLVSAMIHNNPENETTTVIVEEADTDNKGEKEITIYKGDPDMNAEKLRFTIQSPIPTPASEESTVTIQEITDDTPESTKESMETVCTDPLSAKRDASLEIDGKYLKSVVNSRKSPRKTRNGHMRMYSSDQECQRQSYIQSDEVFQKSERSSASKSRSSQKEPKQARSNFRWVPQAKMEFSTVSDNRTRRPRQYNMPLKGSLDSVVMEEGPRTVLERGPRTREDPLKKKSKSYESIKKVPEIYHEDSARTDSTSKLITANDYDFQTDEYCSVCYLVNEMSMRTEEAGSSPNQTFYTLRSNYSSFADEDATECDICSSLNLQESVDGLDGRIPVSAEGEPICELCEICGEVSTNYDTSQESVLPTLRNSRDSRDYIGSRGFRLRERAITDPSLDDDSFEIENCGYEPRSAQVQESAATSEVDNKGESESTADVAALDTQVPIEKLRERYFIPKDEVAILSSGTRKMARKGSLLRKITGDSVSTSQDKRRYSSVDNLQLAKPPTKSSDRSLRSKSNKLIGSADNILSSKSSRRCKSLQRSADNVRNLDSSTDNLDSFAEGSDKEDNQSQSIDWVEKLKMRDNATVKMILMKHGIKIISEKETAL